MSQHEMVTFTWTTPEGEQYRVEPIDFDDWTGKELRAALRIAGDERIAGSSTTLGGFVFYALAAARVVPGLTIDEAEAQLTVAKVRAIMRELNEQYAAREAAAKAEAAPAEGAAVLSPTSAGSEA